MKLYLLLSRPTLLVPVKKCSILGGGRRPAAWPHQVSYPNSPDLSSPPLSSPSPSSLRSPLRIHCHPTGIRLGGTRLVVPGGKEREKKREDGIQQAWGETAWEVVRRHLRRKENWEQGVESGGKGGKRRRRTARLGRAAWGSCE